MAYKRLLKAVAAGALLALTVAACGGTSTNTTSTRGSTPPPPPALSALKALGAGEGAVNILAWAGYAENGSTDPTVDWVTPFEQATGCTANVQVADTSDSMFEKMGTGDFDVVSASGDSSLRMIYAGKVAPVNTDLLTNYQDVPSFQKMATWNSVGKVAYGMPHGWGAQLLAYRTDKVVPAPDSWARCTTPVLRTRERSPITTHPPTPSPRRRST